MEAIFRHTRQWVDERFGRILTELNWEKEISALAYRTFQGGKALRPSILFLVHTQSLRDFARPPEAILDVGIALEMMHAYSLIHDDLPCMDNDDFRRGLPTTHRLVGEGLAMLVGDALLTGAFEVLGGARLDERARSKCLVELSRAAGGAGMVGGQWIDLRGRHLGSQELLEEMHRKKTGALFGAAVAMGCLTQNQRGVSVDELNLAREWGVRLGYLFQLVDDFLDDEVPAEKITETKNIISDLQSSLAREAAAWGGGEWVKATLQFFTQRKL